ncbi:MAG: UDP-N-acetyl-D-glucosamine 6-dehydrogenase [Alphaproteobacteria bacterium MarineAlpha6_Bin4]|nr:MAG: UDP-N-acetyl-D-glucosamine 6-dehydrogenase [Alphaproteobacteria bacterium MarineAlpha6_Bin4]|tara:strand:- start:6762 stop:8024 length:1263 start_codon:yes stop_codon:yes gene_type:complete
MGNNLNISIFGLGYVGLPLAVMLSKYFNVLGYDKNIQRIKDLKSFLDKNNEVSYKDLKKTKLKYSTDIKDLKNSDIFIVTVPTPVTRTNKPDLKPVLESCKDIGKIIKKNSIVVFESTVYPGVTEEICGPEIEKYSKLVSGKDFYLGYSPERMNPGDKLHTVDKIIKVISGDCRKTVLTLKRIYGKINSNKIFIAKDIKTAEAAKVIENTQRDINVAFINEITKLFKKIDINIFDVLKAAQTKWNFLNFKPGFVGGHCIGVDPYYLAYLAKRKNISPSLILSGRKVNNNFPIFLADFINSKISRKNKILILGLTFKENVSDLRNTKVIELIKSLKKKGHKVYVNDTYADLNEVKKLSLKITPLNKKENYDTIILAVAHDDYKKLKYSFFSKKLKKNGKIFDLKAIWINKKLPKKIEYKTI